jgi:hypothetical protein
MPLTCFCSSAPVSGVQASLRAIIGSSNLLFSMSCTLDITRALVTFAISMEGAWQEPLGLKGFTLSNLIGSISVGPPTGLSALMVGGTITIGEYPTTAENTERSITGSMYVNIDLNTPTNNWFYGSVSSLTLGNFLGICCGVKGMIPCLPIPNMTWG